jgi:sugar phosphate isomerase/epimerase
MKLCLFIQASDLIPIKKTMIEKLNNFIIKDEKHDMFEDQPIEYIFRSFKKVGVDGLELMFPKTISDENIEKVANIVKKHNVFVFNIHQANENSFGISFQEIEKLCQIAATFSAKVITLHIDSLKEQLSDNSYIAQLKNLEKKYNIRFGIENMPKSPFTLKKSYTYQGDKFSSIVNKAGLSITFDTTHLGQTGGDICNFYLTNKEKIVNIHLSDYKNSWLNQYLLLASGTHMALGQGELPIENFLRLLKKEKYAGQVTMEINSNIQGLIESAKMIKKLAE